MYRTKTAHLILKAWRHFRHSAFILS